MAHDPGRPHCPAAARRLLAEGARVIDVRSAVEFASNPLPGTLNIPLDILEAQIAGRIPNKNTPLLLHCQSGGRSGIATQLLQRMGYARAFNLGSLSDARAVLSRTSPRQPGSLPAE